MKKFIAGNHKMFTNLESSKLLATELISKNTGYDKAEVALIPPFPFLHPVQQIIADSFLQLGAQDCSAYAEGARTGEVSASMLKSVHVQYVLIGHSERRLYCNESHDTLKMKINCALDEGLVAIYCFGENEEEFTSGQRFNVIEKQLATVFESLSNDELDHLILAYEPVWAIGTGKTATVDQAVEVHSFVRELLALKYGQDLAKSIRIIYGGSVKPNNAKELLAGLNIDGLLVGGASLNANDFSEIIQAVY